MKVHTSIAQPNTSIKPDTRIRVFTFASLGALVIRVLLRRVSALLVPAAPGSAAAGFALVGAPAHRALEI